MVNDTIKSALYFARGDFLFIIDYQYYELYFDELCLTSLSVFDFLYPVTLDMIN